MRRVSKGRLAGKPLGPVGAPGWGALEAADTEALAVAALGSLFDAAAYLDDNGVVIACSAALLSNAGLESDDVVGKPFKDLGQTDDDKARIAIAILSAKQDGEGSLATKIRSTKARALPAKIKFTQAMAGDERRWLASLSLWLDGSRKESESILTMAPADFDAATGMLGRSGFLQAATMAYERDGFKDRPCLVMLDLDSLGLVNARFGQAAGDMVIEGVAERIKKQMRRGDWAGRMGSDEFCMYASFAGNFPDAEAIAHRLVSAIEQPFELAPGVIEMVGVTLGLAMGPKNGATLSELLCAAEQALKKAKQEGVKKSWA
jgi:diguanylate cyclase (GGDEF)-like protein